MNKNIAIVLGIVAILIIVLLYGGTGRNESTMMDDDAVMMDDETMMSDTGSMDEMKDDGMPISGSYEAYAPEKLARAETGDVVLFFHASWCPSCRGLNADIEKNISAIPAHLSILKVNYDSETELKRKYGITYQHTLVQVASDGTLIKKWSGSPSLKSLVSQVN